MSSEASSHRSDTQDMCKAYRGYWDPIVHALENDLYALEEDYAVEWLIPLIQIYQIMETQPRWLGAIYTITGSYAKALAYPSHFTKYVNEIERGFAGKDDDGVTAMEELDKWITEKRYQGGPKKAFHWLQTLQRDPVGFLARRKLGPDLGNNRQEWYERISSLPDFVFPENRYSGSGSASGASSPGSDGRSFSPADLTSRLSVPAITFGSQGQSMASGTVAAQLHRSDGKPFSKDYRKHYQQDFDGLCEALKRNRRDWADPLVPLLEKIWDCDEEVAWAEPVWIIAEELIEAGQYKHGSEVCANSVKVLMESCPKLGGGQMNMMALMEKWLKDAKSRYGSEKYDDCRVGVEALRLLRQNPEKYLWSGQGGSAAEVDAHSHTSGDRSGSEYDSEPETSQHSLDGRSERAASSSRGRQL